MSVHASHSSEQWLRSGFNDSVTLAGILYKLCQTSCESNHGRRSYDVIKIFKMEAVDVANQRPVPV